MEAHGSSDAQVRRPLKRFKVIDLTNARASPVAVRNLSVWGADVRGADALRSDQ